MCEQGLLDRRRILDASIKGLSAGFSEIQLSGFIKVHDHLNPTDTELKERQSAYIELLNLRISRVTAFALKKLSRLSSIKALDTPLFFEHIHLATELPTKGPAKTGLKLTQRVLKRHPECILSSFPLALGALQNESADIQELACDLIEHLVPLVDFQQTASILEVLPACAPTVQYRLQVLFNLTNDDKSIEGHLSPESLDHIFDALSQTPEPHRKQFGLSEENVLAHFPGPVEFDIMDTSVLSIAKPIRPIQTLEELIDTVSHAVEVVDSADEVERIMDGISRLCNQKPDDFKIKTAALLKRVSTPRYSESQRELIPGWGRLSHALKDLLLTWLTGKYYHTPPPFYDLENSYPHIHINRIRELTRRVYKRQAGPLFAAPTHEQGWIDPIQLVARLRHLEADWKYSRRHDLTQALLRIAPDRRKEALGLSENIPSEVRPLFCWAFGGEQGPSTHHKKEYELWIAAGRARSPKHDLTEAYTVFKIKDKLPDSARPACYTWNASTRQAKHNPKYLFPEIIVSHNQEEVPKDAGNKQTKSMPGIEDVQNLLVASFKRILSLPSGPLWKRVPTTALHSYKKIHAFSRLKRLANTMDSIHLASQSRQQHGSRLATHG